MRIVIVGNGVAGIEAAREVSRQGASRDLQVTLVSEESDHFFSRTALMWVHSGQLRHRDIEPFARDYYEQMGWRRVRGRVMGLDPERRQLLLAEPSPPVSYDRLLLCCGARPRRPSWPGMELHGVGTFVTLQDLSWYETELWGRPSRPGPPRPTWHQTVPCPASPYRERVAAATGRGRPARQVVVVGGGLIGIEAAELARARGAECQLWFRDATLWANVLRPFEAEFVADRLASHGVVLRPHTEVVRVDGDEWGRVVRVVGAQGEQACDAVVVAIGVVPNTTWLEDSGLARSAAGALRVDRQLRTNLPLIWAAGDCARLPDASWVVEEASWYSARAQGRLAGANLIGQGLGYRPGIPYTAAKLADLEYTGVGEYASTVEGVEHWEFREKSTVESTTRITCRNGCVVGFSLLGRRWDTAVLADYIQQRCRLEQVLRMLHAAAFDTECTPALQLPARALVSRDRG